MCHCFPVLHPKPFRSSLMDPPPLLLGMALCNARDTPLALLTLQIAALIPEGARQALVRHYAIHHEQLVKTEQRLRAAASFTPGTVSVAPLLVVVGRAQQLVVCTVHLTPGTMGGTGMQWSVRH